jgi:hypothetical protein
MADDTTGRVTAELGYLRAVGSAARAAPEGFDTPMLLARFGEAVDVVEAVLELADGAKPAASMPPADCSDACAYGPCDCSGNSRPVAWDLDPARVREVIARELLGDACTPACWTPVACPSCGGQLPPRYRSVPLGMPVPSCCDKASQDRDINPRHLWNEEEAGSG